MDDPQYQEGIEHMQAGRWQEAIDCFEQLAQRYPNSRPVQRAVEDARFKVELDEKSRVRAKRWIVPWRTLLLRFLLVLVVLTFAVKGGTFLSARVAPMLEQARIERHRAQLLADGNAFLEAGDLDAAEARFQSLLDQVPGHAEARRGLDEVAHLRDLEALYVKAVAFQEQGRYKDALAGFTDLSVLAPDYRDVSRRITAIRRRQELRRLFEEGEAAYEAGDLHEVVASFEQIRALDVGYRTEEVVSRLADAHMMLGRNITEAEQPPVEELPQAIDHFGRALALRPRYEEAEREHRLGQRYLDGLEKYYARRWHGAINDLKYVYDQRPDYLGGVLPEMLYDLYIRSGDAYREVGDLYRAFEQYRQAAELPVSDPALALGRAADLQPNLTPTPTPTVTPTPEPQRVTPYVPPVYRVPLRVVEPSQPEPTPTPTPRTVQLAALRNRIIFFSDHPAQPGLWAIDPADGSRQYIGNSPELHRQHADLVQAAQRSPDGRYRLFVAEQGNRTQIFMRLPDDGQPHRQLTKLNGYNYHPIWSPNGGHITFVSQDSGSDDIWVMNADGGGARNLTQHRAFEKHPAWSPDGGRLAFWSNRSGVKQIYLMDADGRNVRNISNSGWNEYDPLWVR